jgi:YVTN family beta-propeller protein
VIANITVAPRNSNANVNGVTVFSFSDPDTIVVSPNDEYAYVGTGGAGDDRVMVIDLSTNKIVNSTTVGSGVADLAITPDGKYLYATTGDDKIFVIDTATDTVNTTLTGFGSPMGIAITSDGKYAYTENNWNNTVFVLNTATNTVDTTVSVGQAPRGLAFTPDGEYAYVICDTSTDFANSPGANYAGTVSVINTGTNPAPTDSSIPTTTVPTASSSPAVPEFPIQLLVVVILVVVITVSAIIIVVKEKRGIPAEHTGDSLR